MTRVVSNKKHKIAEMQTLVILDQVLTQNIWVTMIDSVRNCRLLTAYVNQTVADETFEIELTVDGIVFSNTATNFVAGTKYYFSIFGDTRCQGQFIDTIVYKSFMVEGHEIKLRVRKTTAAGANSCYVRAIYQILR